MNLIRVDTQDAYHRIREKIITLEMAPGAQINEHKLAQELDMGLGPVQEAFKLLAHEDLIVAKRHGIYVTDVNVPDLAQLSEMRLTLESLCARLAAERATADDLAVLEALCRELPAIAPDDAHRLFDLDHRFHRALAQAAHNRYLAKTLDHFLGLSQRLWYLALPHLDFLPAAVEEHLEMIDAVKANDAARAEQIMRDHVQDFYDKVHTILEP